MTKQASGEKIPPEAELVVPGIGKREGREGSKV
jgi:hypothetical protein